MQTQERQTLFPLRIQPPPCSRTAFRDWWTHESGYRAVIALAWPLFLSQGSSTILQFIDRMFLTWYSPEGMAAAGPSGMFAFTLQALFLGLIGYATTFVAQYTGANKPRRAVSVTFQALYLAVVAALIILLLVPVGGLVFHWAGHAPEVQRLERIFFSIFLYGAFAPLATAAISSYFIGRGRTKPVLWICLFGALVNIVLDYPLIFGRWGFPEMGVAGAAIASVVAQVVGLIIWAVLFAREIREVELGDAWRLDLAQLRRLLRFGSASGIQFALDMITWTTFLLLIGRLGTTVLGATNLAFQLNTIAFFPNIGFGMAAATLVGQNLGKNRSDLADRAVWSAYHLSVLYTAVIAVAYVAVPGLLVAPFGAKADPAAFAPVHEMTMRMLRFIALYCLFDVGNLIFAQALKGAGDTLFVMLLSTGICSTLMLVPTLLWCVQPGGLGVFGAWGFLTLAICVLSFAFLLRYLRGHWRTMRVIEHEVVMG